MINLSQPDTIDERVINTKKLTTFKMTVSCGFYLFLMCITSLDILVIRHSGEWKICNNYIINLQLSPSHEWTPLRQNIGCQIMLDCAKTPCDILTFYCILVCVFIVILKLLPV